MSIIKLTFVIQYIMRKRACRQDFLPAAGPFISYFLLDPHSFSIEESTSKTLINLSLFVLLSPFKVLPSVLSPCRHQSHNTPGSLSVRRRIHAGQKPLRRNTSALQFPSILSSQQ